MKKFKGKMPIALSSHKEIPRAQEGEAGQAYEGPVGQTSAVSPAAYYQPSLTAEYDEDSPGGDFDFFSNLVTKWEAAARLPGDSTRQVVVRSGEDQGPGHQMGWNVFSGTREWLGSGS